MLKGFTRDFFLRRKTLLLFIKFLLVGALNTLFGYGLYAFFVFIGCGDFTAPLFSTIGGVLFNYKTTGRLVFNNSSDKLIFKFFLVYLFTYLLTVIALKVFAWAGLENRYAAGAIVLLPMALISFYLNKNFVFKEGEV